VSPPPTIRAFIAGVSGSGKSVAAWSMYLSHFPRRILVDQTGEWSDPSRYPKAPGRPGFPGADFVVQTVPQLSWAIHKLAPTGRWTIVVELDLDDLPELVDYLIPVPNLSASPIYACHGAVLLADEVDLIAPPRSLRQEVRTLYRRSRHVGLSIVSTTQRPEAVSREVSAQSSQVLCLALAEPSAYDYMGALMGMEIEKYLEGWTRRHPHGGLWLNRETGVKRWVTEAGALVEPAAEAVEPEPAEPVRAEARARPSVSEHDDAEELEEPEPE
jgi:hypothetical protein